MRTDTVIELQGLTWWYPHSHEVIFSDFDLNIEKNDFCFVVGESGVGKTTLVKFLIRQLTPPTKMIFYHKEDIARFSDAEVQDYRRNIGVIYQDFKLITRKNVYENVAYPLEIRGVDSETVQQKVEEGLARFGLADKQHVAIHHLSGGEKQRVAIVRALITSPEFIIADEPTGNLDRGSSTGIGDALIDINKSGNTIVCITHNHQFIKYVQDKQQVKIIELT